MCSYTMDGCSFLSSSWNCLSAQGIKYALLFHARYVIFQNANIHLGLYTSHVQERLARGVAYREIRALNGTSKRAAKDARQVIVAYTGLKAELKLQLNYNELFSKVVIETAMQQAIEFGICTSG